MIARVRAFTLGVRDGFAQPYDLSSSTNVEHLAGDFWGNQSALDYGASLGQFLRAGRRSQAWEECYAIPLVRRKATL